MVADPAPAAPPPPALGDLVAFIQRQIEGLGTAAIFGAHDGARRLAAQLRAAGVQVSCFCDWNSGLHGTRLDGIEVRPVGHLKGCAGEAIVIADHPSASYASWQLRAMGLGRFYFEAEYLQQMSLLAIYTRNLPLLHAAHALLADEPSRRAFVGAVKFRMVPDGGLLEAAPYPQYFHPGVRPEPGDVVLDCGAFDGSQTCQCAEAAGPAGKVYAFEPSPANLETLRARAAQSPFGARVEPVGAGVWESDGEMAFDVRDGGSAADRIVSNGGTRVPVVSLDSFCRRRGIRPTLIKMDVEGVELPALRGAAGLIRELHPKLQISVYHRPPDIWEIPLWIHEANPAYRLYLSHHMPDSWGETVVYAG